MCLCAVVCDAQAFSRWADTSSAACGLQPELTGLIAAYVGDGDAEGDGYDWDAADRDAEVIGDVEPEPYTKLLADAEPAVDDVDL